MNMNELSMINFAYFTANFPCGFTREVWPDEGMHFENKLLAIVHREAKGYVTMQCFMEFFFSLSTHNKKKLCEWIEKNYHFSSEHK